MQNEKASFVKAIEAEGDEGVGFNLPSEALGPRAALALVVAQAGTKQDVYF